MNKVMNMNKEDVLKLEEELSFDHFDAEDAYCIGNIGVQGVQTR